MDEQEVAHIDPKVCDRSPGCPSSYYCPSKAINIRKSKSRGGLFGIFTVVEAIHVDTDKCTGCGTCVQLCPHQAIALKSAIVSSDR